MVFTNEKGELMILTTKQELHVKESLFPNNQM